VIAVPCSSSEGFCVKFPSTSIPIFFFPFEVCRLQEGQSLKRRICVLFVFWLGTGWLGFCLDEIGVLGAL
jgi:hypothetical protein